MKSFFFLVITLFIGTSTHAQRMTPISIPMKTPMGTIQRTEWVYHPDNYGGYAPANYKMRYRITLANDSVLQFRTKIDHDTTSYFIYAEDGNGRFVKDAEGKRKKIRPSDTKDLHGVFPSGKSFKSVLVSDSCWFFKIGDGAIKTFSVYPDPINSPDAFQAGDGAPIEKLTKEALKPHIADEPKTLKLLEKGKLEKAIKVYNSRKKKQGGK
jgi:hypothetical protein